MFTNRLINELGLLNLQPKSNLETNQVKANASPETQVTVQKKHQTATEIKLDKNEFRLLVKMLQAINHECIYDNLAYDGTIVTYQHPKKTLVFGDITLPDTDQIINLSSLHDLLLSAELKRPVWEKLKTLKS